MLTDFVEFRLYQNGKRILTARLGTVQKKKLKVNPKGEAAVRQLLTQFLTSEFAPPRNPKELALRMAPLTHIIRDVTLQTYHLENESDDLHAQLEAFRTTLIPDLKPEQFADMYAQTIAYGLFAAACQPRRPTEKFTREKAAYLIPKTNPFLRKLFNRIAGPDMDERILPFVDHLVSLLRKADMDTVLQEFGKRTGKEDPVVHFYEVFLLEYDPKVRKMRGVYYTPEPVVLYIVRSIDHLLKTRFNKPDGLADKNVLILDPACGTGTFLYHVIRHIHDVVVKKKRQKGAWNSYVSQNLLKRIFGFELLMAPYAVAHLKLGLLLKELGYKFASNQRLGIYLTNTLEEAIKRSELMYAQWIADEANAAAEIKKDKPIMVVLGNPPYSGHSANRSYTEREIKPGEEYTVVKGGPLPEQQVNVRRVARRKIKLREKTFIGKLLNDYYFIDQQPLGEKNPKWLQDDYVKFIRFAQWRINKTGYGILGFITNHGYLDNPTFRGMRQQLLNEFTDIHILDLHGNSKKKERAPDGSKDENVFDIQQGVAIGLFVKDEGKQGPGKAHHAELWGLRQRKSDCLDETNISSSRWQDLQPQPPFYLFAPRDADLKVEFDRMWGLKKLFPVNGVGMTTARDHVVIGFETTPIQQRAQTFRDSTKSNSELSRELDIPQKKGWNITNARNLIKHEKNLEQFIKPVLYRPFDDRYIFYHDSLVWRTVKQNMFHMLIGENVGLTVGRAGQVIDPGEWNIVYTTRHITEFNMFRRGGNNLFPLYLYNRADDPVLAQKHLNFISNQQRSIMDSRRPNLNPQFVINIEERLKLNFVSNGTGDLKKTFGPEDIFHYIYAIFYSPTYRQRYAEFLKIDFPRVPLTSDRKLFAALCRKGTELVSLHLMESPQLSQFVTKYEQKGDHLVEKVRWEETAADKNVRATKKKEKGKVGQTFLSANQPTGRVWINKTQYFEGVPKQVWEFHIGGYQVCEKWLKDRKKAGRKLSADDIDHYQKIVVALNETIRLMREIDDLIPGWPLP